MKYLRLKGWEEKIFSTPSIPRNENFVESIYKYLHRCNNNELEEKLALRLKTNGFLSRDGTSNWKLTEISKQFLNTEDEKILFQYINNTVKFFGEILYLLNQERLNIGELLRIANRDYLIVNWKQKNQVSSRLQWLSDLKLVEYSVFENLYNITEKGQNYLKMINNDFETLGMNENKTSEYTELINSIPEWIFEFENTKSDRVGYIPGTNTYFLKTIKEIISLIKNGKNDVSNLSDVSTLKELKKNSKKHFIKTLIDLHLIRQTSLTTYEVTHVGEKVLLLDDFQFIFYFDRIYTFVLEILSYMDEEKLTKKELLAISQNKYTIKSDSMSKRLHFLEKANLIYKVDHLTYSVTDLGKRVITEFNITRPINNEMNDVNTSPEDSISVEVIDSLIIELRQAASDSTNPSRFERAINNCFIQLGYDCKWLGNSGETDVLAQTKTAPVSQYKIIIDAKSTSSPTIGDSSVVFDTLKEHKEKYTADYIVIVGIKFTEGRLVERAKKHKVALLDVDILLLLLKNHYEVPLGYKEYEKFFSEYGIVNSDILMGDRNQLIYQKEVIYSVLNVLTEERTDEVTKGLLTPRDIYLIVKSDQKLNPIPSVKQIKDALDFLSSPFIRGVEDLKGRYSAKGSVTEISNILNFLFR